MIELSSILQQWASSSSSPKILAVLSSPLCLPWCLVILSSLSLYPHKPQDVPVILIHCLYKICISGLLCVTLLHWLWLQEYIWHDIWSRFCSLRVGGRQGMSYLQDCLNECGKVNFLSSVSLYLYLGGRNCSFPHRANRLK